jgi:hypothetical protein
MPLLPALTITHAGLNTALESLSQGVPMVAIPITNDQPGIASRLEWLGVAEVVAPSRLSVQRLGAAIQRVLREPAYREKARRYQQEIAHLNGLALAPEPPALEGAKDYRERYEELIGPSLRECPVCHQGRMLVIEILPRSPHRKMAITDTS